MANPGRSDPEPRFLRQIVVAVTGEEDGRGLREGSGMKDDELTRLLFVKDEPEPSSLALVFGHHDRTVSAKRARHAARLYLAGLVPTVLLTGGLVRGIVSEADEMALVARAEGVPERSLLLERSSKNTFENVSQSLALL